MSHDLKDNGNAKKHASDFTPERVPQYDYQRPEYGSGSAGGNQSEDASKVIEAAVNQARRT